LETKGPTGNPDGEKKKRGAQKKGGDQKSGGKETKGSKAGREGWKTPLMEKKGRHFILLNGTNNIKKISGRSNPCIKAGGRGS